MSTLGLFFLVSLTVEEPIHWEYKAENYKSQKIFMKKLTVLGKKGWELVACPTTSYSKYRVTTMTSPVQVWDAPLGRSVYCILKRPKTESDEGED